MMQARKQFALLLAVCFLSLAALAQGARPATAPSPNPASDYADVLAYIHSSWDTLTRDQQNCPTVVDPKVPSATVLYLPQEVEIPQQVAALREKCKIKVEKLPFRIDRLGDADLRRLSSPGLLYLPNPYVVPGGRFNEMYGWDSYFTIVGLLADNRVDLARGMVENFFYEVEHYGAVLNANRTYYLTRSQPPFLTTMINDVWQADQKHGRVDVKWLERAYQAAVKDHDVWTREPHLAGTTGLSRYFDFGEGPVPEEIDTYKQVAKLSIANRDLSLFDEPRAGDVKEAFVFDLSICSATVPRREEDCEHKPVALSRDYYKGDRSMRESGYDIAFRFGPYGSRTHHFAAVCLNSLLYRVEMDLAAMATQLKHFDDAAKWGVYAKHRQEAITRYFWNEQRGMFFDYDFTTQKQSTYEFLSTFYPLWAGLATKEQAQGVARNIMVFEKPGGMATSPYRTGMQWDYPYVWAPPEFIAVEGLRRAGYQDAANRLASAWLSTVAENYRKEKTIREKYNAETRTAEAQVTAGYQTNVVGFGWTNAVFAAFVAEMQKK